MTLTQPFVGDEAPAFPAQAALVSTEVRVVVRLPGSGGFWLCPVCCLGPLRVSMSPA